MPALVALHLLAGLAWTLYVVYLKELLGRRLGLPPESIRWIVMADQLVFFLATPWFGWISDSTLARWGRRFPALLASAIASAVLFAAIPLATGPLGAGRGVSIALVLAWVAASSSLRAPVFALLGRQASARARAGFLVCAGGLAGAVKPLFGPWLAARDPLAPFLLSAVLLVLAALATGLVERGEPPPGRRNVRNVPWGLVGIAFAAALGARFLAFDELDGRKVGAWHWSALALGGIASVAVLRRLEPERALAGAAILAAALSAGLVLPGAERVVAVGTGAAVSLVTAAAVASVALRVPRGEAGWAMGFLLAAESAAAVGQLFVGGAKLRVVVACFVLAGVGAIVHGIWSPPPGAVTPSVAPRPGSRSGGPSAARPRSR